MYIKIIVLFLFIMITYNLEVFANEELNKNKRFNEVVKNINYLNNKNSIFDLAINYKKIGNFKESLELLESLERNDEINFHIADIYKMQYDIDKAIKIFENIKRTDEVIIKLSELYLIKKDERKILQLIENTNGILNNIVKGIYYYSSLKLDIKKAQEEFEKAYNENPKNKYVLFYLAQIYLDINKRKLSEEFCNKSIQEDYFYSNPHSLLGYIKFLNGNIEEGFNELIIAKTINPYDLRALTSLGNGMTKYTYKDLEKNENLKLNKEIKESRDINEILKKYPNNIHTYIRLGSIELDNYNYDKAINYFLKALSINNYYGLANNGLAISLKEKIRSYFLKKEILNLEIIDYSTINEEEVKKIFINFDLLNDLYKKIIKFSIYNLRFYLKELISKKATHYIIPIYEKSTDYLLGNFLKDKRTFDNRLWDDVRGRGGLDSATGIEDLLEAYYKGFNTLVHEFAHQIHQFALSEKDKNKILELYNKSKKENRFMDYYSESNEYEYFAQGIEAYISDQGKSTLKDTSKNTREILFKTDKELYFFIEELLNKP